MAEAGKAFVKGGCGCLVGFVAIGLFTTVIGGSMRIDIGGAVLLFLVGGILGLVVLSIYREGVREGKKVSDVRPCPSCGRTNSVHSHICPRCGTHLNN
jgi:hypothetical protein